MVRMSRSRSRGACATAAYISRLSVAGLATMWLAAAPAVSAARAEQPVAGLVGKVYQGVLTVRVIPPRSSGQRPQSNHGKATAVLEAIDRDHAQFILNGTLLKDGDASFVAPGRFSGVAWAGRSESFDLSIQADGTVRGEGTFGDQPMTFEGTFDGNDLKLVVELTVTDGTGGGFPTGTRFQFGYDLRHFPPSSRSHSARARGDGGCREVVYRLKLTPNLFGSGLSSVRVPECVH